MRYIKIISIGLILGTLLYAPEHPKDEKIESRQWVEGQRGWSEDGTNLWTAVSPLPNYNVGIGIANPSYRLDVNGHLRISGGIHDGTGFGSAGQVLVSTGADVYWADFGGSGAYIWNQFSSAQTADFWITGQGRAGAMTTKGGQLNTANSGVFGISNNAAGAGVFGEGGTSTAGVWGQCNISTNFGVGGVNVNASGTGILGVGNNVSGAYLVAGSGIAGTGGGCGIFGLARTAASGVGVVGIGNNTTIYTPTAGAGVSGTGFSIGVIGYNAPSLARNFGFLGGVYSGVVGYSDSTAGAGVFGDGGTRTTGTWGQCNKADEFGVGGSNLNASGTGIVGAGNNAPLYYLAAGSGGAFTGTRFGSVGFFTGTTDARAGGYFSNAAASHYVYVAYTSAAGANNKILGTGAVSTIMQTRGGKKMLFAPESPEAWFEDFGEGRLKSGRSGKIELDPYFLDCVTINEKYPLKVFVQLRDDCKGVYVKTYNDGFEVIELQNGTSNAAFSYRVVAKWKGYEGLRFPDAPEPLQVMTAKGKKTQEIQTGLMEAKTKESIRKQQ